ncbi:MAG: acyl carrier protein [Saprospiraceae bacterium]
MNIHFVPQEHDLEIYSFSDSSPSSTPISVIHNSDYTRAFPMINELVFFNEADFFSEPLLKKKCEDGILGAAADAFKVPKHQLDMNGSSQTIDGWDSMAHLLFVTNLEEQFKVRFNSKEIMVMNTLADAAQILTSKLS